MNDSQQPGGNPLHDSQQLDAAMRERQRLRERRKLIGLLAIALFILALAFIRFGKTIPWGAR